jgi:putative phosphoribosyl transferase
MAATADREVSVEVGSAVLEGRLTIPSVARGAVIFAHGSGSSRHSPRNRAVASALQEGGFATLLFDLLTPDEEGDRAKVFDIPLLGERLVAVTRWLRQQPSMHRTRFGYFGASTGAGAALRAAAELGAEIGAVVSRGGRPDLAGPRLADVTAPTLLVVGGSDPVVLDLNRAAAQQLQTTTQLVVVAGATHLFEEAGAMDVVIEHASAWFAEHLSARYWTQ